MKNKPTSSTKYGRHIPHNPTQKQLDRMSIQDLVAYSRHIGIDVKEILLETIAVRQEDIEYIEDRKNVQKKRVKMTITKKELQKKKKKRKTKTVPEFMRPLTPSPALAEIVGSKPITRTEVVKKFWDYIKKHNLQNQENRRMIDADDVLRPLFGKRPQVSMFELAKVLGEHLK